MFGLDAAAIALICVGASALIGAIYNKYQAYKHNKAIAASEEEVLLGDDTHHGLTHAQSASSIIGDAFIERPDGTKIHMTNATLVLDEQNARPRSNSATSIYSNNRPDITDDASVSVAKSVADLAAKALVDVVVYAGSKIWLGAKSLFGFGQKVKKSDDLQDGVNRDDVSTEDLYEFQLNNSADQNERILTGENVENNTAGLVLNNGNYEAVK